MRCRQRGKAEKREKTEERWMLQICYFGDKFAISDSECGSVTRIKKHSKKVGFVVYLMPFAVQYGSYARVTKKGKGRKKRSLYYLNNTVILLAFILQKASVHRPFYRGCVYICNRLYSWLLGRSSFILFITEKIFSFFSLTKILLFRSESGFGVQK